MSDPGNVTRAEIVLTGLPHTKCFTSWQDFLAALPSFLSVEVPSSITNVIVSNIQPTSSQTADIWFRTSNSGSFIGIYVFAQGVWHQIYPVNVDGVPDTTQIFWLYGDSANPPAGWTNTDNYAGLSVPVKTALKSQWVLEGAIYTYYSAVFTSF